MTKKRFTYEYDEYTGNLFDNKMNTFYHIEDSDENIEVLCDRLNWLVEENERLKEYNNNLMKQALLFDVQTIPNTMEIMEANTQLEEENEELKKTLGAILLEVKRDITITNQTGEIKVFINPNRFELISEVLRKYGALKEWYE